MKKRCILYMGWVTDEQSCVVIGICLIQRTRKCDSCECIAAWGHLMPHQSFSTLIMTPCQVWSLSVFCCWYITLRCDLDLWPSVFDLWPWTFAVYRLWHDESLYHIWTQLSNPQWSYCDFSVWPNNLKHVLRVALGSGIIFTKFDLWQLIHVWIIAFLCWYVM